MFKKRDLVMYRGTSGLIHDVRLHDLGWTRFTLYKVELSPDYFEWINGIYLRKAKG